MPYDPKSDGWMTIFQINNKVTLPEQLTPKWWEKKKQVVAKMTKSTGMGEALKSLDDVFSKVNFEDFNAHPLAVKEKVEQIKQQINSAPIKKLHDELKTVRDLAEEQAKPLRKNPLTKKTAEVLDEIYDVAEKLKVCVNPGSLSSRLKEAVEFWQKDQIKKGNENAVKMIQNAAEVRKTLDAKIKALRDKCATWGDSHEQADLFDKIFTLGRNMTTPLGNMLKATKAGFVYQNYDESGIQKLYDQLKPIGGAQNHTQWSAGLDQTKTSKLIDKMEGWGREFVKLTKDMAAGPEKVKV